MAELFGYSNDNIALHLKNIYDDNELSKNRTTEEISVVQKEGNRAVSRKIEHYNLDAIIAVQKARKSIEGSLRNPNLGKNEEAILRETLNNATLYINRMFELLNRYGEV